MLVVRAAGATYGPMNVVADGGSGDADGSADTDAGVRLATTLRTAVFVVAYLGVLSALVSAWAEYGDGVLLGLQNLQHERTPVAA